MRTICEDTEFSERTVRSALKLLEERGFIRPCDQRHASLGRGGNTRPKQYRATVWDLCVERDPEVLAYLGRTHREESIAPEGAAPSENQSRLSFRGAAAAPLYKPSGNNHHDPLFLRNIPPKPDMARNPVAHRSNPPSA